MPSKSLEGPCVFPIEVLTHKQMHKFYVLDSPSPFIAGLDLVVVAHLIIDAVGRTVYTRSPFTNSYVSASLDPISPPATDVAVITSSDPRDEPSPLLLLPSRPRLSRRRLHPPRPHTRRRMPRDTPLSPLSPPASTNILYLLRPSRLMRRPPVLTPQTPTYRNTFGSCSLLHFRRPTCRLPWPQRTSSLRIRTFLPNRQLTSGFVTSWSTTSTQPMRLLYGNHLVDPL